MSQICGSPSFSLQFESDDMIGILEAEAKRCHILCMSAVAAGLVAKSRLFGASFAGAARGISSRNALRPGGD